MRDVPHWQWFILLYFLLVAIPVMIVHFKVRKLVLQNKTPLNLVIYFAAVTGVAFLMHFIAMYLYFKFIYTYKP
jgi:hypothetical protein